MRGWTSAISMAEMPSAHTSTLPSSPSPVLDGLGRHPVRGADEGVALAHRPRELSGDAEVGELDAAALGE